MTLLERSRLNSIDQSGFTLMELLMVIMLVSVLAVVSISTLTPGIDEGRFDQTVAEMKTIRTAITGDLEVKQGGTRSSFGYVGDIGSIPTNAQGLSALVTKPAALPNYGINTTARFGVGWNGPYVATTGLGSDITKDAWGTNYVYNATANPPTITSYGADGVAGGTGFNQDIVVQIPTALQTATVHGFISQAGVAITTGATIDFNSVSNGAVNLLTQNINAAAQGYFSFNNIPLGVRSAMIYVPSKASPTVTLGPILFTVDNANFVIPGSASDTSFGIASGGGGGGGGGGGPPPCTSTGNLTYVAGSASLSGNKKSVLYRVNVTANLSLSSVIATATSKTAAKYTQVTFDGSIRSGLGLIPNPGTSGQNVAFGPSINATIGNNKNVQFDYDINMQGESLIAFEYKHDQGCDLINVPTP